MVTPTSPSTENAIRNANRWLDQKPVYIDTETTGLEKTDEVVEISILDHDGSVLLSSLVRPASPIPATAQRIHGITNEMVANAPAWPVLWPRIRNFLFGRVIAAYNAPFDMRLIQQSHSRYRLPWRENFNLVDVLPIYSDFRAIWDPSRRSMRYFKLEEAGSFFKITLPNAHRSSADALLTRAVLHCIAGRSYS